MKFFVHQVVNPDVAPDKVGLAIDVGSLGHRVWWSGWYAKLDIPIKRCLGEIDDGILSLQKIKEDCTKYSP